MWQTAPLEPSPERHGPAAGFTLCTSHKTSGIPGQCLRSQPEVGKTPSPSRAFWQSCPPGVRGPIAPVAGRAGGCGPAPCSQLQEGDCQISFQNPQNHFAPYYLLLLGLSPTCPHFKISLTPSRAGYSLSICSPSSVWAPDCEQMAPTGCLRTGEDRAFPQSLLPGSHHTKHADSITPFVYSDVQVSKTMSS